jgi:hypothetical protein
MNRVFLFFLLCFPLMLTAQNEYRLSGVYLGNSTTGLRNLHVDFEVLQNGKWKWMHKADISTGLNLDMATVVSDTNYDARSWSSMMADEELKGLYTHFMDTWLTRIGSTDQTKQNNAENTTNNTISVDLSSKILTVQVRGIEGDNRVWIDIVSLDNQFFVSYNKPIIAYSNSLLDMSTVRLRTADYIVKVTPNKGPAFSAKISIF